MKLSATKRLAATRGWVWKEQPRDERGRFSETDGEAVGSDGLTDSQFDSLDDYKNERYEEVNQALRDGEVDGEIAEIVEDIDSAFESEAGTLTENKTLYRSANLHPEDEEALLEDPEFLVDLPLMEDPAYMSTSANEERAKDHMTSGGTLIEIDAAAGDQALAMDELIDDEFEEEEYLLPRGQRLVVDDVMYNDDGSIERVITHTSSD